MILWSIQRQKAYEQMLETGVLRTEKKYIWLDVFEKPYQWMAEQMRKRIGAPPEGVEYPVWAWYQWKGKRKRPNMRIQGRSSEKNVPIVLLTIEVPEENVLLSDFDYWHAVLNNMDLVFPMDEDAVYPEEVKRKSWENIFDISCSFDGERKHVLSTQATLWEIKKEWVRRVEYYRTH